MKLQRTTTKPHSGLGLTNCVTVAWLLFLSPIAPAQQFQHKVPAPAVAHVVTVTVPDVRGQTPEQAQSSLRSVGLSPRNTTITAGDGKPGTVCRLIPPQGATVIAGAPVDIFVVPATPPAGNPEFTTTVPNVVGEDLSRALQDLRSAKLLPGRFDNQLGNGKIGAVQSQNPTAGGNPVPVGTKVDLVVTSENPTPGTNNSFRIVPPLAGLSSKAAAQVLRDADLSLGREITASAEVPLGTIFKQNPPAGSRRQVGSPVNVWVAGESRQSTIEVPDLSHLSLAEARSLLRRKQLWLGPVTQEHEESYIGLVISQSPPPGIRVPSGSEVDVIVASSGSPVPYVPIATLGVVLLGIAYSGYAWHGRWRFRKLVRISVQSGSGTSQVSIDSAGENVVTRVRLVHPPGETRVSRIEGEGLQCSKI